MWHVASHYTGPHFPCNTHGAILNPSNRPHMSITPVILCGGSGTRLWPLSRQSFPK